MHALVCQCIAMHLCHLSNVGSDALIWVCYFYFLVLKVVHVGPLNFKVALLPHFEPTPLLVEHTGNIGGCIGLKHGLWREEEKKRRRKSRKERKRRRRKRVRAKAKGEYEKRFSDPNSSHLHLAQVCKHLRFFVLELVALWVLAVVEQHLLLLYSHPEPVSWSGSSLYPWLRTNEKFTLASAQQTTSLKTNR